MVAKVLPFVRPTRTPTMTQAEMRRLVYRKCGGCGHEWTQPALTGACPVCHSEQAETTNIGMCAAPYRR